MNVETPDVHVEETLRGLLPVRTLAHGRAAIFDHYLHFRGRHIYPGIYLELANNNIIYVIIGVKRRSGKEQSREYCFNDCEYNLVCTLWGKNVL